MNEVHDKGMESYRKFEGGFEFNHIVIGGKLHYMRKESSVLVEEIEGQLNYSQAECVYMVFVNREKIFEGGETDAYQKFDELMKAQCRLRDTGN